MINIATSKTDLLGGCLKVPLGVWLTSYSCENSHHFFKPSSTCRRTKAAVGVSWSPRRRLWRDQRPISCVPDTLGPGLRSLITLVRVSIVERCAAYFKYQKSHYIWHSCLKWPLEEIYNLIFENLTYSAILVPYWKTWQKKFFSAHILRKWLKLSEVVKRMLA